MMSSALDIVMRGKVPPSIALPGKMQSYAAPRGQVKPCAAKCYIAQSERCNALLLALSFRATRDRCCGICFITVKEAAICHVPMQTSPMRRQP